MRLAGAPVQRAGIYIQRYREKLESFLSTSDPVHCYLEVAETNSVVVEIPKLFLAGEQNHDELVNVNKMPTNLEGSVVESAFFGVFSKENCCTVIFMEDCRIISRRITEFKLTRSRFVSFMLICTQSRQFARSLYFTLRGVFTV